jgi:predicted RNA binding protein YcfA (HicA-like mRNA interferase family)
VPITARRLVRFLKRRGWIESRQRGSHLILIHPDFPNPIAVPMHARDLHKGLFLGILKNAGFSLDDFHND